MSFWNNIVHVFVLILTIFDFGSDIWVGINLYYSCHYKFAAISFFLTALPALLFFIFFAVTSLRPNLNDKMTRYVKERSGLTKFDFIGLIVCFPLQNCVIAFRTWFLGKYLSTQYIGEQNHITENLKWI